ncbi:hypothetical protein [Bifidobacterium aquikefiricola]|uniref:Uncharacterized protein n=1 Tax=Bifidobacterium aquikefiricola TaxID=3059038 RepID=A0AB39U6P6_9BIFI
MPASMIVFATSASRHGFELDDVTYAYQHIIRRRVMQHDGETYIKFTGRHHGDPLVPSIEVMMKHAADGRVIVFHVNAEQGNFWDKD